MTPQDAVTVSQIVKMRVKGVREILFEKHEALDDPRFKEVNLLNRITISGMSYPLPEATLDYTRLR